MPTYTFRCNDCQIDWLKFFRMSELPKTIGCGECGADITQKVTGGSGVIFKGSGFPGNDMKDLHSGSSAGTRGRKPTHSELEYVEKEYPDSNKSSKGMVEKIIDESKTGSKKDAIYSAHKRAR